MTNFNAPGDHPGFPSTPPMGDPVQYPEKSQTVLVFVLGLCGLVICQLLGPVAWYLGNQELAGIDAGRRPADQRGLAQAGRIMGIVGSVLIALLVIVGLLFVGAIFVSGQG